MFKLFKYFPYIFIKKPIYLTIFLTSKCNSNCIFCFYRRDPNLTLNKEEPDLTVEEIEKISNSIGSLIWISFSGGEVFLREDLVEISKIFYNKNKPFIMLYSTNGLQPDVILNQIEKILSLCKDSIIVVKLSLDGIGLEHDLIRGVKKSFEKVMETYHHLNELAAIFKNLEIGFNTVFCSINQNKITEIINFVNSLKGVRNHSISLIRGEIDKKLKDVDIELYLRCTKLLQKNLKRYSFKGARLKAAQDILRSRLIYKIVKESKTFLPCYAGQLTLTITHTGKVFPCENFSEEFLLGSLREQNYDLKKILNSQRTKQVIARIKNGCYCTHECYLMINILFNPKTYFSLFKEYFKLLLAL